MFTKVIAAAASVLLVSGAAIAVSNTDTASPMLDRSASATVIRWSDGDTVVTSRGRVRLIGIDTPELGRCGSKAANRKAQRLAPVGTRLKLVNPASVQDTDAYGRLLRYVDVGHVDVGLQQLKAGLAIARYDGLDGYDSHPRQSKYRKTDAARPNKCPDMDVPTATSTPTPTPTSTPTTPPDLTSYPPLPGGADCPSYAPIKGNRNSGIYHVPGQQYYDVTRPEECFASEAAAIAAGYRRSRV